jgi:hypothetical protein
MLKLRAQRARLTIGLFTVAPSHVPAAGGRVELTAVVTHASSCTFTFARVLGRSPAHKQCGSGKVTAVVTLPPNTTTSARSFRFNLTASGGGSRTSATPVTVVEASAPPRRGAPKITREPANTTVSVGATVSLTAAARGTPTPRVRWQVSDDGGHSWMVVTGATSGTYAFAAAPNQNGWEYRAVFANSEGSAKTAPALLNVRSAATPALIAVSILTNPASVSAATGASAEFTAAASGSPMPTVQWQLSTDGGVGWSDIAGATSTSYAIAAVALAASGDEFRAVFTNAVGSVATSAAALTVIAPNQAPAITTQPINEGAFANQSVTFTAAASGQPAPSVQWYVSTDAAQTWVAISGATSASYTISSASLAQRGYEFRAVFTNSSGSVTTDAGLLTVSLSPLAPAVTTEPSAQLVIAGQDASFIAAATGVPTPTVQWYVSTNAGGSWTPIAGATSPTYSLAASASEFGDEFVAVFTNIQGSASTNPATLTVEVPPQITVEPSDRAVVAGATVSFSAAANGVPTPSVQWEVSTNNGASWGDVGGATSPTYSFSAEAGEDGFQYRAVFSNGFGSPATSAAASLAVGGDTSTQNWSGYVANQSNTRYTMVTGSWVVPTAICTGAATDSAEWVGIDGDGTPTVEQDGTDSDCSDGMPVYFAWSEFYPAPEKPISDSVAPGDTMTGSVSVTGSSWTLTLHDDTAGWTATIQAASQGLDEGSAEWIVERPSLCPTSGSCQTADLTNFGTTSFTGASATANGLTASISGAGAAPVQMVGSQPQNPDLLALPSALGGGGDSFSDTWYASS